MDVHQGQCLLIPNLIGVDSAYRRQRPLASDRIIGDHHPNKGDLLGFRSITR